MNQFHGNFFHIKIFYFKIVPAQNYMNDDDESISRKFFPYLKFSKRKVFIFTTKLIQYLILRVLWPG